MGDPPWCSSRHQSARPSWQIPIPAVRGIKAPACGRSRKQMHRRCWTGYSHRRGRRKSEPGSCCRCQGDFGKFPLPSAEPPVCQAHDKKYISAKAESPDYQSKFSSLGFLFLYYGFAHSFLEGVSIPNRNLNLQINQKSFWWLSKNLLNSTLDWCACFKRGKCFSGIWGKSFSVL